MRQPLGQAGAPERDERGVGHADERGAQQRRERDQVGRVEHGADERRGVDGLAATEVATVLLDSEGDAALAQRLEVALEVGLAAQQNRRVLGSQGAGGDSCGEIRRHRRRLAPRRLRRAQPLLAGTELLLGRPAEPVFDRRRLVAPLAAGEERLEARRGLALPGHDRRDHALDLFEHAGGRPEVGGERFAAAGAQGGRDELPVDAQARSAPAVDRLLGVADQEEAGALRRGAREREAADDHRLQLVGVLELVDEQLADAVAQARRHSRALEQANREAQ